MATLTNDMSDTKNWVEGRVPIMMKMTGSRNMTEDHMRKVLYSSTKMEEYRISMKYTSVFTQPIDGGQIFTHKKGDKVVNTFLWLLKEQTSIIEPIYTQLTRNKDGIIDSIGGQPL